MNGPDISAWGAPVQAGRRKAGKLYMEAAERGNRNAERNPGEMGGAGWHAGLAARPVRRIVGAPDAGS